MTKAILAATLIAVSSAFAEDVFLYDMSAGAVSVSTYTWNLRSYVKECLAIMDYNNQDVNILRNNPDVWRTVNILIQRYGFTKKQVAREFEAVANERAMEAGLPEGSVLDKDTQVFKDLGIVPEEYYNGKPVRSPAWFHLPDGIE